MVPVTVKWTPGNDWRPANGRYLTAARFLKPDGSFHEIAWSVEIEFELENGFCDYSKGSARLIVDEAPRELLASGSVFETLGSGGATAQVTVD